jgi:hypothetical protein
VGGPFADLKRYLVPYAQHIGRYLRKRGKQGTHSEIAERIEVKTKVLGIESYVLEQQLDAEISYAVTRALTHPRLDKADALGNRLQLKFADRAFLRIKTIGACDVTKAERKKLRKARNREQVRLRAARKRAERGAVPREDWLTNSKSRTQPWKQQGISRATYYRGLRKAAVGERETGWFDNNLSTLHANQPVSQVTDKPKGAVRRKKLAVRSSHPTPARVALKGRKGEQQWAA